MESSGLPRITIVTPSYNQGSFLEETILSVINQNYPNLEYFVIDGGSTDDSVDIIKKYADKIDWWVSERDNGQSDAIAKGFKKATGDLLAWLNSDDVYFPDALLKIGMAYSQNPNASIYAGGIAIGDKGNGRLKKCSLPTLPLRMFINCGLIGFGQQSSFFRAEDYRAVGGLNRNLHMRMDGDIMYRLMKYNSSAAVIDDMIGFFRWHGESKSTKEEGRYFMEMKDFIKSLKMSENRFNISKMIFRVYRLISGGYIKSYLVTRRYKNMRMSKIWSNIRAA
jgi:glycosyltransferase involved in cell wall biosynthesis